MGIPPLVARLLLAAWLVCHLLFPLWLPLDGGFGPALARFAALCAAGAGLLLWLRPALAGDCGESAAKLGRWLAPPDDKVLWALAAVVLVTRAWAVGLPVTGSGDEAVHMGLPALPFKLWARRVPVPHVAVFWAAVFAAWRLRGRLASWGRGVLEAARRGSPLFWAAAAACAAAWFLAADAVLQRAASSGYETLGRDLLRFPPLSKLLRMGSYGLLGVSSFAGRLPESLFYLAGGLLVHRTLERTASRAAARLGAALFWLSPPISYFGVRGSQQMGELFFFLLSAYFCAVWLAERDPEALYWGALAVGVGAMYRYTVPVAGAVVVLASLLRPASLRVRLGTIAVMGAMAVPWHLNYVATALRPYAPEGAACLLHRTLFPAQVVAQGFSVPLAALLLAAALAALCLRRDAWRGCLAAWVAVYYVFIAADKVDAADCVRLMLPMCLPLVLLAAEGLTAAVRGRAAAALSLALGAALFVHGTWRPLAPISPDTNLRHSLRTDYYPWSLAAAWLDREPAGTQVATMDFGGHWLAPYLQDRRSFGWTQLSSGDFGSVEDLRRALAAGGARVFMYLDGAPGYVFDPRRASRALVGELRRARGFEPSAVFTLGDNSIVVCERNP